MTLEVPNTVTEVLQLLKLNPEEIGHITINGVRASQMTLLPKMPVMFLPSPFKRLIAAANEIQKIIE